MDGVRMAFYFVLAYFVGAIPTAYLAGKLLKNIDIRQHGSGNVGATNVFRVLGKWPGAAVLILDLLKGALPVYLFLGLGLEPNVALTLGLAAILGHVFTPFLGFKGGKGVAAGAGVLMALYPGLFGLVSGVWALSFLVSRIVSLSSLIAVLALCVGGFYWIPEPEIQALFLALACLVFWTHRRNIQRLARGEEKKIVRSSKR